MMIGLLLLLTGSLIIAAIFGVQIVYLTRQVRKLRLREADSAELAFYDPLTRIPNRRLFMDRLTHALELTDRRSSKNIVVFIDLDNFGQLNARTGDDAGDRILAEVAARWRNLLRSGDTLARWGADEFVILIEELHATEDINAIVERLQTSLDEPFMIRKKSVALGASAGITIGSSVLDRPQDLIKIAETAMQRARRIRYARNRPAVGLECCLTHRQELSTASDAPPQFANELRHPA